MGGVRGVAPGLQERANGGARLMVGMRLIGRFGASRERLGVRWEAFSATPLSQAGTILRTTNDAHRQITRGFFRTGRSQSGVADASASPSYLCHRTPRRYRDSRSGSGPRGPCALSDSQMDNTLRELGARDKNEHNDALKPPQTSELTPRRRAGVRLLKALKSVCGCCVENFGESPYIRNASAFITVSPAIRWNSPAFSVASRCP